jgi:hypothetical protein
MKEEDRTTREHLLCVIAYCILCLFYKGDVYKSKNEGTDLFIYLFYFFIYLLDYGIIFSFIHRFITSSSPLYEPKTKSFYGEMFNMLMKNSKNLLRSRFMYDFRSGKKKKKYLKHL